MNANRQRFRNFLPTRRTQERRAVGSYFYHLTSSFFRFLSQERKEQTPRTIGNTSGKRMVFDHAVDVQILDENRCVVSDVLIGSLMQKVFSLIGDAFMCFRNKEASFPSSLGAFYSFSKSLLSHGKESEGLLEKEGIVNLSTIGINKERPHANINTNFLRPFRKRTDGKDAASIVQSWQDRGIVLPVSIPTVSA